MTPLNWEENYNLNVKEIDDEHRNLFVLFNRLEEGIITGKSQEAFEDVPLNWRRETAVGVWRPS